MSVRSTGMSDFEERLLKMAERFTGCFGPEELNALSSKSNFVLKSDTVLELDGEFGSCVFLDYSTEAGENFAGVITEKEDSQALGLYLKVFGKAVNEELFYLVLQNFRSMLRAKGVMVKGAGKELWVRLGKKALEAGIYPNMLAGLLLAKIKQAFAEIESAQVCFIRGDGPLYAELNTLSDDFFRESESLKAKVWEARGYNFTECHVLGHCGKCADRKLCANVRRIDRLSQAHRINEV